MIYEHRLYAPMVGAAMAAPVLLHALLGGRSRPVAVVLLVVIAMLGVSTVMRHGVWRDQVSLWSDVAAKSPHNFKAQNSLGAALQSRQRFDEAIRFHHRALELAGEGHPGTVQNLANALDASGRFDEAIGLYRRILQVQPNDAKAHYNLGKTFHAQGALHKAETHYRKALSIEPRAESHDGLAHVLHLNGNLSAAIDHYRAALKIDPGRARTRHNFAVLLYRSGHVGEALEELATASLRKPDWSEPLNVQAWILATHPDDAVRNPRRALSLARSACALSAHRDATDLDTLAAALAADGQFNDAVETARQALAMAEQGMAHDIRRRLDLYERGEAYRELPSGDGAD